MAESKPLMSSNSSGESILSSCYRSRCKYVCVQSKGALLVLVISILLVNIVIISGALSTHFVDRYSFLIFAAVGLYYLFYPILGLLGEKWMRYKVMIIGIVLICVGFVIITVSLVSLYFLHLNSITVVILLVTLACPFFLGYGLFQANVIQFGTDQLQFSPSEELSSFIYWLLYMYYCPLAVVLVMASIVTGLVHNNTIYYAFTVIFGSGCFLIFFAILSFCCFKHHLVIELAQDNNPVKLIWRVIKYAWKHKQPVRRSAFTFGESLPSRLDLAKERYGGPFTTVQVEDVKSFLYILSILLGIFGYGLLDSKLKILDQYLGVVRMKNGSHYNVMESALLIYPLTIPYCVVLFAVPLYQFIMVPFFSRFIPSMLKRMWIGLMALLVESIMITFISYMINHDFANALINEDICLSFIDNNITSENGLQSDELTLPFYIMAVPQFFAGISILGVHFTSIEFILAQGPRIMQGLLIGIWLINNSIYCVHLTLAGSQYGCYWEYYAVKTGVVFISVILYTIAAYKYKYRQRNEQSDVNERVIITEYTERQLEQKYLTEDEENDDDDDSDHNCN